MIADQAKQQSLAEPETCQDEALVAYTLAVIASSTMLSSLATAAGLSRPKKKFHFDVSFTLEELKNLTFLTGAIFAKVRLRDGGTFSVISNR